MKTFTAQLNDTQYQLFKNYANSLGVSCSEVFRFWIDHIISGEVPEYGVMRSPHRLNIADLSPAACKLWMVLKAHSSDSYTCISLRKLSGISGMTVQTVRKAARELQDRGAVETFRGNVKLPTMYKVKNIIGGDGYGCS